MKVLCSGYTKDQSQGIYQLDFKQAKLQNAVNIAKVGSPTYLQYDEKRHLLFAVAKEAKQGGINLYHWQGGQAELLDSFRQPGASPAYLGIDSQKQLLYSANYHTGYLRVFSYQQKHLQQLSAIQQEADTLGPQPEQDAAHPHFFAETPAGNLAACDLGNDTVTFYRRQQDQLVKLACYHSQPGMGCRHLVFSTDGHYFYLLGELSSQINLVKFDESSWQFTTIATYSTISASHNGAAAIYLSADGHYLYASNRGENTLVVFHVQADHQLALLQRISTFGDFPRDFNFSPDQHYLLAANQRSNNLTLYRRQQQFGTLTPIVKNFYLPEGTRVLFTNI